MGITFARLWLDEDPTQTTGPTTVNGDDPWCQIFRKRWCQIFRNSHKPLLALNVATPPTFTERLRIAQCMDRQRAVEALPHLSEQEKRVARSLLPSGRLVEIHEDQAIRGLREYDIVWCQPYNGDKRTNVYRIKEDLKEDVVRILGAPPN